MLTGDLLRVRVNGKALHPAFVGEGSERLQERAQDLVGLFTQAVEGGWTRGELEAALRELEGDDTDHKLSRGLAKVLWDRCEVETVADLDPQEVRRQVFALAAARGPLARGPGPSPGQDIARPLAREILDEVAAGMGTTGEHLARALYADLKEQQRLTSWRPLDGPGLLRRYDVALVQAVLLRAFWLKLRLVAPDPRRLQQLLRAARFHELMVRVDKAGPAVLVHLDGPESLLRQSTRYGMQLATFFPTLLLQTGTWALEAEVAWGKGRLRKSLTLTDQQGLVSHARDIGAWKSRTEQFFEDRWGAEQEGWTISPGEVQVIAGQHVLVPAWTFRKGGRTAHLDVVGYWRKGYLEERLQHTPPDVVLAVSKRLCGDKAELPAALAARVVPFAEIIPVKQVLERLEAVGS
ncbi:DUF790 family protein [Myxococcota bacterium]|nr:DUF790 family protein [Myxococcota bacterium]